MSKKKNNTYGEEFKQEAVRQALESGKPKTQIARELGMALKRRQFPKGVIVHSDRGSQYCSHRYQQILKDNELTCSMSGEGNCYDNAVAESFFHSLKVESIHGEYFKTREEAQRTIFEYIEIYYNKVRLHSALGYQAPERFDPSYQPPS